MLKKIFLLTCLALLSKVHSVSGQQFSFEKDTVYICSDIGTMPHAYPYEIGDNWGNIEMHNYITNITTDTFFFHWQVIESQTITPEGWTWFGFCDNRLCRAPFEEWIENFSVEYSNLLFPGTVAPENNRDFKAMICAPSDEPDGTAVLRVRVEVENGQVDTTTFIFNKPCNPLGVKDGIEPGDDRVKLAPNPATDNLKIYADKELNASSIYILNTLGAIIATQPVYKENTILDIKGLSPGMYLIRIEDKKHQLITTRKFVKY